MSVKQQQLIRLAYDAIGGHTPLSGDCGTRCGAACCEGEGGMMLFPGEADLLRNEPDFTFHRLTYGGQRIWWMGCPGHCHRAMRPLACRVYPLAPRIENGSITAQIDLRATPVCPLTRSGNMEPGFYEAAGAAFRILAEDEKILIFMQAISDEVESLDHIIKLLL